MVEGPVEHVEEKDVGKVVKRMKDGNAAGPPGVSSDKVSLAGWTAIGKLIRVFGNIMEEEKSPEEWKDSFSLALFYMRLRGHRVRLPLRGASV